ncbi:MAG: aldehyde dehydrogenase EutE [Candidatus Eremiobacteraeota bacterium]|nr:aldehyde dehydrogenase EutE [Candidatus Eremiobacteraeota bacterium]
MELNREEIGRIVEEVVRRYSDKRAVEKVTARRGIFEDMDEAIEASHKAQRKLAKLSVADRKKIIQSMRDHAIKQIRALSELAVAETGYGRVEDKIEKHRLTIEKTPGVEDIFPTAFSGDHGLTLVEMAPYGVIGSITPSTNPSTTVINNSISMISAGNSVVFNPHPQAQKVSQKAIEILNEAVEAVGGPPNLMTTVEKPSLASGQKLLKSPLVRMLVVTGGPEIVRIAMTCGKKVIAAGPGNPPVLVDETADIKKAAADIVLGASFDCNVMCIAEKEVFAVESIFSPLKEEMVQKGAFELSPLQADELTKIIFKEGGVGCHEPVLNRDYVGKPPHYIAKAIGLDVPATTRLLIAEFPPDHPLVHVEQLMPFIPLVRVRNVAEGIERSVVAEGGCLHTASMHSRNIENLSEMASRINATIFVKNAPTLAGLGFGGEGHTTLTISTPTGEGVTSARTFTRQRRCVLVDYLRIV